MYLHSFISFFLLILCIICPGCSSKAILSQRGPYLRAYHAGNLIETEQDLTAIVEQKLSQKGYIQSKDATWILLDRATTYFAMGKIEAAIQDYSKALEAMDYYSQDVPAERLAQIMLQDETGAYQADDFEQILARLYFALALIHQGDESNAYALLRQAEEYQQEKQALYNKIPFTKHYRLADNGLSKYLFATLLDKRGDVANAQILYKQALRLIPCVNDTDAFITCARGQATVLVVCHNGNAPYKISATSPASVASAAALEILLASLHIDPACSSLMGVPVPTLRQWPFSIPQPTYAVVDEMKKPLLPFYNVNQAAAKELEQKMPVIVARGIARLLVRRTTVGYLEKQEPCLGALADLAMCVVNSNTRADTRSWTTLPSFIDLARFNLEAGLHTLEIEVYGNRSHSLVENYYLNLKPNDLCIIHVFNIHPGVTRILIPDRFIIEGE